VCIALCTIVAHNIAQNRPDSFPPYPPDNHHISDDVDLREGGVNQWSKGKKKSFKKEAKYRLCFIVVLLRLLGRRRRQFHVKSEAVGIKVGAVTHAILVTVQWHAAVTDRAADSIRRWRRRTQLRLRHLTTHRFVSLFYYAITRTQAEQLESTQKPAIHIITFCASRSQGEMYIGHGRLCVCLSLAAFPHNCMDPDVTWGNGRGCPLFVHYWADLQSVHGFCCYDNIAQNAKCHHLITQFFTGQMVFRMPNQRHQSTEGTTCKW